MIEQKHLPFRRVIIVDPTLKFRGQHEFTHTSEIIKACKEMSLHILTLVSKDCEPQVVSEINGLPHFEFSINSPIKEQKEYWYYLAWITMNRRFDEEMERCNIFNIDHNDIVIVHTASESNSFGLFTWYERLPEHKRPFVCLEFHSPNHLQPIDKRDKGIAIEFIRRSLRCWASLSPGKVLLGSTNKMLSDFLSTHAGTAVQVLPTIARNFYPADRSSDPSRLTFAYMGQARPGKGFHLICAMLLQDDGSLDRFQFIIQAHSPYAIQQADIDALAQKSNVTLITGTLDGNQYDNVFTRADVIINFYSPYEYRASVSGIFLDSLKFGLPAIVSPGTTMADEVSKPNMPGKIGKAFDVGSLKAALFELVGEWTEQKSKALACADHYKRNSTSNNYMSQLIKHFETQLDT